MPAPTKPLPQPTTAGEIFLQRICDELAAIRSELAEHRQSQVTTVRQEPDLRSLSDLTRVKEPEQEQELQKSKKGKR